MPVISVEEIEKECREEIIRYSRSKSVELFRKGPKKIEVVFNFEGFDIIVIEPYNKTEIALFDLGDEILTGSVMTIRHRICHLFSEQFENDIGNIVNRRIRILTPEFNNEELSITYRFLYINC